MLMPAENFGLEHPHGKSGVLGVAYRIVASECKWLSDDATTS
jgi:hypothetical protein